MPTREEIKEFSDLIENLSYEENYSLVDAIVYHCDSTGLELEVAATLISPILKQKIKEEAEENNLMKKTSKLPI
jgi:Phage late-transcription coactivator